MLLPTKGPKGSIVAAEDLATLLYNLPKLLLVDQKFLSPHSSSLTYHSPIDA
jgi:hypothetical protein